MLDKEKLEGESDSEDEGEGESEGEDAGDHDAYAASRCDSETEEPPVDEDVSEAEAAARKKNMREARILFTAATKLEGKAKDAKMFQAAKKGSVAAAAEAFKVCRASEGRMTDYTDDEARRWGMLAAEGGDADAQHLLAYDLHLGGNDAEAFGWWVRCAKQGEGTGLGEADGGGAGEGQGGAAG